MAATQRFAPIDLAHRGLHSFFFLIFSAFFNILDSIGRILVVVSGRFPTTMFPIILYSIIFGIVSAFL